MKIASMNQYNVCFAPQNWCLNDPNPFTGAIFDDAWRGIFLNDIDDDQFWNGTSNTGLFSVSFNRQVPNLSQRLYDYLSYETVAGNNIIIGSHYVADLETHISKRLATAQTGPGRHDNDAAHVVHSTSRQSWESIQKYMSLKSPNQLRREAIPCEAIGKKLLGDPPDFLDYIHLAPYATMHTEYVVLSRERGRMSCEANGTYTPGVRIYLDNFRMIDDGLIVRDGLHSAKVRDRIDLATYMVDFVTGYTVHRQWTPRGFADYATKVFEQRLRSTQH
jgi:hypothetical protein